MTTLAQQAAADLAAIMADANGAAASITYTTAAGAATTISAIVFDSQQDHEYGGEGEFIIYRKTAVIQLADIAAPSVLDTVTIDSAVWKIERVGGAAYGKATLELVRDVPRARQNEMLKKKI